MCRILLFLAAALALGTGSAASAHLTPNSEVRLSFANDRVTADIIVPQGEYASATGNPVGSDARSIALARRYLAERIKVTGEDGKAWAVSVGQPEFVQIEGPPDLHATATLVPPAGSDARAFDLEWRVLVDTLPNHFALVVVDAPGQEREIVGAVRAGTGSIRVDMHQGTLTALGRAIALGAAHIATGFDHLLLLPAPLVARAGSWSDRRSSRGTLGVLARIVTAFTVGHSSWRRRWADGRCRSRRSKSSSRSPCWCPRFTRSGRYSRAASRSSRVPSASCTG